jgi:hypothetical protein
MFETGRCGGLGKGPDGRSDEDEWSEGENSSGLVLMKRSHCNVLVYLGEDSST